MSSTNGYQKDDLIKPRATSRASFANDSKSRTSGSAVIYSTTNLTRSGTTAADHGKDKSKCQDVLLISRMKKEKMCDDASGKLTADPH